MARPPLRPAARFFAVVPARDDELRVDELLLRLVVPPLDLRLRLLDVLLGVDALLVVLRLLPAVVARRASGAPAGSAAA